MTALRMGQRLFYNIFTRASRRKSYGLTAIAAVVIIMIFWSREPYTGSAFSVRVFIFGEKFLPQAAQEDVDYIANNVNIEYNVVDNLVAGKKFGQGGYFLSSVSLINHGSQPVPAKHWNIYGYLFRILEPGSYPYPHGFYLNRCGLKVFHIGGNLYKFEPAGNFYSPIMPQETRTCILKSAGFQVAKTDSFPNWYVVGNNLTPKVFKNTVNDALPFVGDFNSEKQYKRRKDEYAVPYSAPERYKLQYTQSGSDFNFDPVIPTPLEIKLDKVNTLEWNSANWFLVDSKEFKTEVQLLAKTLQMKVVASKPERRYIIFSKESVKTTINNVEQEHPEAYAITTDHALLIIHITANSNVGAFYAIQTLLRLLSKPEVLEPVKVMLIIPSFTVKDAPRYTHRGLMIDVARNFINKGEMKKVIDVMATYKMNRLHLHLADDEGWRLEIPGIPELTSIGSRRCHDPGEEQCLMPMLGSGPFANTSGSGFYTIGDYHEILKHAMERHVEIIPEFDMPGHSRAAIKSIHAKSQRTHRTKMNAQAYTIIDENDMSVYKSGQHFTDDVMDPCLNSTYVFVTKIMAEVKKLHEGYQPLNVYHFGGDEVAEAAWSKSPSCKLLQQKRPDLKTHFDLKKYFIKSVAASAAGQSMSIGAWEDGLLTTDDTDTSIRLPFNRESFKNKEIYAYVWKRPVEQTTPHRAVLFANYGYKVVLAYGSYLYFDHPYEPDPEERGLYWATRKVSTRDVWSFSENVMFADKDLNCPRAVKDKTDCTVLKKPENVVGIQAELWTETVRNDDAVDYMLFPRLLAVAERAWHKASWEDASGAEEIEMEDRDWLKFISVLGSQELRMLDLLGVKYRVPPPGAVVVNGKVQFNVEFPSLDVEYFSESSQTWTLASHNMPIQNPLKLRTRSTDGKRYSRVVVVYPWDTSASWSIAGRPQLLLISLLIHILLLICH